MKSKLLLAFMATAFLVGDPSMAKENTEKEENLDPVYYLALDGNVKAALELLKSIDPQKLSSVEVKTRQKYLERFDAKALPVHPVGDKLVDELIAIYRSYWDRVLLQKLNQTDGYHYLFQRLVPIVKPLGGTAGEFSEEEYDRVGEFLTVKLKEAGYFALIGAVKPHLNFMAWKRETVKPYRVDLGDGETQDVDVVLMDDFVSLGWAAYATFDKLHVGGWVGEKSLHCVASSYDLESENFKASFLAHEARHFSDKKKYSDLSSADLEYRAKLNEIFLVDHSFETLFRKFLLEQRENPDNPHSYASFRLVKGLSGKIGKLLDLNTIQSIDKRLIQKFAKELLREDTHRLNQKYQLTSF